MVQVLLMENKLLTQLLELSRLQSRHMLFHGLLSLGFQNGSLEERGTEEVFDKTVCWCTSFNPF